MTLSETTRSGVSAPRVEATVARPALVDAETSMSSPLARSGTRPIVSVYSYIGSIVGGPDLTEEKVSGVSELAFGHAVQRSPR